MLGGIAIKIVPKASRDDFHWLRLKSLKGVFMCFIPYG